MGNMSNHAVPWVIVGPLFAAAMLAMSAIIGRRILSLLRATDGVTPGERAVISVAVGLSALQFVPFLLGVAGILREGSIRVAMLVVAVACAFDGAVVVRWAQRQYAQLRRPAIGYLAWIGALSVGLVIGLFQALAPATDPDGVGYHLAVPQQWLADGTIGFLATYTPTNSPSGAEMLYAIGLGTVGDSAAKMLHLSACALAGIAAYLVGRRVAGRPVGIAAGFVVLLGPLGIARLSGTALIEGFVALMVAVAILAWLVWTVERNPSWLMVVGAASGFAVTFKLTAAAVPLALVAVTIALSRVDARRIGRRAATLAIGAFLVPTVPWLIRATIITGNPVFPALAGYIPSTDFPADMAKEYETFNRVQHWGGNRFSGLGTGTRELMLIGAAVVVVAIAGAFMVIRRGHKFEQAVAGTMAGVALVQLFAVGFYPRYWIPSALVLALPLLYLVRGRLDNKWVGRVAILVACALSALQVRTFSRLAPVALVTSSFTESRRETYFEQTVGLRALYDYANTSLPDESVVLQSYLCAGFYLEVDDMCGDMLQGSIRFDQWDEFTADLVKWKVTHVITPLALGSGGPRPSDEVGGNVGLLVRDDLYESLSRLLRERGRLVIEADDFGLYELTATSPEAASS
jgi:hypothetical protein